MKKDDIYKAYLTIKEAKLVPDDVLTYMRDHALEHADEDEDGIQVGDKVRSFDFHDRDVTGNRACYKEGIVEDLVMLEGCRRYKIRVTKSVFGGEETIIHKDELPTHVYPPVNGTEAMFGVTNGVIII